MSESRKEKEINTIIKMRNQKQWPETALWPCLNIENTFSSGDWQMLLFTPVKLVKMPFPSQVDKLQTTLIGWVWGELCRLSCEGPLGHAAVLKNNWFHNGNLLSCFCVYRFHSFWSALFSQIHFILLSVFDTKLTMYFFYFQKSECQKVCVHIIINLKCIKRQSYHDIESPCSSSYIHVQHVLPSAFSPLLPCCTVFFLLFFFLKDELPLMVSLQEQRWCVRLDLVLHL